MVAIGPTLRVALKVAPIALEVTRQLDRQLRPHVLAYRRAREVDGYVGRWTGQAETHWVVFPSWDGPALVAFPPLDASELATAARALDRTGLKHHRELPEARLGDSLRVVGHGVRSVRGIPGARLRRDDERG